jgi:aspartate ammonia-lyase
MLTDKQVHGQISDHINRSYAEGSFALVTALNPHIGYLNAAVAKESLETGKSLRQIVKERNLMTEEELAQVLNLEQMSVMS